MKNRILQYINEFNAVAQIKIEYAALEPFYNSMGKIIHNIHIVYSPSKEYLIRDYLGAGMGLFTEQAISGGEKFKLCMAQFKVAPDKLPAVLPVDVELFDSFSTSVISNIGRFYNFRIQSPTDPFLTMFLEKENIVFATDEFRACFLDSKNQFQPSITYLLNMIQLTLQEHHKKSTEYGVYSNKDRYPILLIELHKTMKLYFITLNYIKTGILQATCDEQYSIILNTLSQAAKPWEFVLECIANISNLKQQQELQSPQNNDSIVAEVETLKQKCYDFLLEKLIKELKNTN